MKLILEGCIMLIKLKSERIKARKAGDKLKMNILGVVIGQCDMYGSGITTADVVNEIRKTLKAVNERIEKEYSDDDLSMALAEAEILNEYMPKEIDDYLLLQIVNGQVQQHGKNMGLVMQGVKAAVAAQGFPFNGKKVKAIIDGDMKP